MTAARKPAAASATDLASFEGHKFDDLFFWTLHPHRENVPLEVTPAWLARRQQERIARLEGALQGMVRACIPLAHGRRFTPERREAVEQARAALAATTTRGE